MQPPSRQFYKFLGFHSFLMGLFPFFVPVFLWKLGFDLASLFGFIALSGSAFCLALWAGDRLRQQTSFARIITLSFVIEFLAISIVFWKEQPWFLPVFGLLVGSYSCCFWIIQRLLFIETITPHNSGRKFGNLQIFVFIILKSGIFIGGISLEKIGFEAVYTLSGLVICAGIFSFLMGRRENGGGDLFQKGRALSFPEIVGFNDHYRSKIIFAVDGVFLFMESYLWLVTLFLLVHQNFWQLSVLVIVLAAIFGLIFLIIKNTIDQAAKQRVYVAAVLIYAVSWGLRGLVSPDIAQYQNFILVLFVSFFTSFFRLAFNKRFFDLAQQSGNARYIFLKSYYSQFFIALAFGIMLLFWGGAEGAEGLRHIYWAGGGVSFIYLLYREPVAN